MSPEDRENQRRSDAHHIARLRRVAGPPLTKNQYTGGLKPPQEKKACIMNPHTSDELTEGQYEEPEMGSRYRAAANIYSEKMAFPEWISRWKQAVGDAKAKAAVSETLSREQMVKQQTKTSEEKAKTNAMPKETEEENDMPKETEVEKLAKIRRNMEFLLQDEQVCHADFTRMHYQTDRDFQESTALMEEKMSDPRYISNPRHTASKCLENYRQSFIHQEQLLKVEEEAFNGMKKMEDIEAGLTAEEKSGLFGDDMDLDGMADEVCPPYSP